jgi:sirohydrochlorin cobaltochelatase
MDDRQVLDELQRRFSTLLPEEYRDRYEDLQPLPMGSAGVRYGADGKVAWDQMWGSFCDLAMAGGPPHRGTLLSPATAQEIDADPRGYDAVVAEICRGISMVTDLLPVCSSSPGWVRMECATSGMAGWLLRAITIENIAVRTDGVFLELPAGPAFRPLKEIRNVITVIAKTTHYWVGHMSVMHRQTIADLIAAMNDESPLVAPVYDAADPDWRAVPCESVGDAVWMMRMLVAANVLARREGDVLFVPINAAVDPDGGVVADSLALVRRLSRVRRAP